MFNYAPEVKVGDVFTRTDKNGTVWRAEVINRTEYFVDVKKFHPYEVKFSTGWYEWDYEKRIPEPTVERAQLYIERKTVPTGRMKKGFFKEYPETEEVPTGRFFIGIKEDYGKHSQYDKIYYLEKSEGGDK